MRQLLAALLLLTAANAQAYNGFTMPTRTSTSQPTCTAALENNVWTIGSTANVPTLSQVCTCANAGTSCAWVTPGTQIVALNQTIASGNANVSITTNDAPGAGVGGSLNFRGKWYSVTPLWTDFASISGRKETAGDGTSDAGYLALSTRPLSGSQTERVRITSAGFFGINVTNPLTRLDVSDTNITTANGSSNVSVHSTDAAAIDKGGSIGLGGQWYTVTPLIQNFAVLSGRKESGVDGTNGGYLAMATQPAGGTMTEWMRIASTGKVGIGTASASEKLSVAGPVVVSDGAPTFASRGFFLNYDQAGTAGVLTAWNGSNAYEAIRVDTSSFQVVNHTPAAVTSLVIVPGISTFGTSSSTNNVFTYGMVTARPPSTDTVQGDIRLAFGNGSTNAVDGIANIQSISNPIGNYLPVRMDSSTWSVRTDPTTVTGKSRIFVDGAGLVGVGTDAPAGKFQVNSNETVGTGTISSSGTAVTGSGTAFDTQLAVGDTIKIVRGFIVEYRIVATITNATSMTINTAFSPDAPSSTVFVWSRPELTVATTGAASFGSTVEMDSTNTTPPTCAADGDVGRFTRYTKSAGATISICLCTKLANVYTNTALGTGDCT